jgi:hypothetical protein
MKKVKQTYVITESSRQDFEKKLEEIIEKIQGQGLEADVHYQMTMLEREGTRKILEKYSAVVLGIRYV